MTGVENFAAHLQYSCSVHRTQLSEANDKMLAVQECYISVCKEKEILEESIRNREKEEALMREDEVYRIIKCAQKNQHFISSHE